MKPASIVVLILFTIVLLISLAVVATNPRYIPEMQMGAMWMRQTFGTFIATIAGMAILIRCLNGSSIAELMALVIALLAGLAISAVDWTLTIPLGLFVIGYIVKEIIELFRAKQNAEGDTP